VAYKRRGRGGINPTNDNTPRTRDIGLLSSQRPEPI
jgi:hypothetical protein